MQGKSQLSFSIGQVAQHTGLPQSVLRYWETVFELLKPHKSQGGTRLFSQQDIQLILRIKDLLYEKGYTIKGANLQLKKDRSSADPQKDVSKKDMVKKQSVTVPQKKQRARVPESVIALGELQVVTGKLKELIRILEPDN